MDEVHHDPMRMDARRWWAVAGAMVLCVLAIGCPWRRDDDRVEFEIEDTITTTSSGNTTTTVRRGPAPGWERRGDP